MWTNETFIPAQSIASIMDSRIGSGVTEESTEREDDVEATVEWVLLVGSEYQSHDADSGQKMELEGLLQKYL